MKKLLIITTLVLFAGIAFGQTVQKDKIVSIHEWTVKLKPDVTMNQFLQMWEEKFTPVVKKVIPEMKPFVIKVVQDTNKYVYAGLYVWDSIDELRKYFNEDGSPTEQGEGPFQELMSLMSEVEKYGEFTYTAYDYIVIQ